MGAPHSSDLVNGLSLLSMRACRHERKLLGWLEDKPDLFCGEIVAQLADAGVGSSASSVARHLARHGITPQKDRHRCGRAAPGAPFVGAVPHGHGRNNTFIAALLRDRSDTPMLIGGHAGYASTCA